MKCVHLHTFQSVNQLINFEIMAMMIQTANLMEVFKIEILNSIINVKQHIPRGDFAAVGSLRYR